MKNKIIVVIDNDNIVTRVLDYSLLDTVKDQNYKIYSVGSDISKGMMLDNYTDDGKILPLSERIEKGLFEVPSGKTLDINATGGEYLRDKNELELYKDDPTSEINILKTLDINATGGEYIRDKTMLEKYNDELITKDEYNTWAKEGRTNAYSDTTDKLNLQLMFDTGITAADKIKVEEQIQIEREKIKEQYPYIE